MKQLAFLLYMQSTVPLNNVNELLAGYVLDPVLTTSLTKFLRV